jgi:hypothetical protein
MHIRGDLFLNYALLSSIFKTGCVLSRYKAAFLRILRGGDAAYCVGLEPHQFLIGLELFIAQQLCFMKIVLALLFMAQKRF